MTEISRRTFLKATILAAVGALLPRPRDGSENEAGKGKANFQETKTVAPEWEEIGPPVIGGNPDGIRASCGDGELVIASTWNHGSWVLKEGNWSELNLPVTSEAKRIFENKVNRRVLDEAGKTLLETPFGVGRHILILGKNSPEYVAGNRAVIIFDNGIQVIKEEGGNFVFPNWRFPEGFFLDFAQAGCLVGAGSKHDLLVGGSGGIIRVWDWENGNFQWEPVLRKGKPPAGSPLIMIRTIVADTRNPSIILAGGWWGYSGQEKDQEGRIKPGAGVWKTEDGGETWRQVLADINVNCLFIHPQNENIIIAGTEGSGDDVTRTPDPEYPSLYITLDGGRTWVPLTPKPPVYDLVTPQRAFVYDDEQQKLWFSFWGGPVMSVRLPPEISQNQLELLEWKTLTPVIPGNERAGFYGGHLWRRYKNRLVTGSFPYWVQPTPSFTPLRECLLPEENRRRIFFPSVRR